MNAKIHRCHMGNPELQALKGKTFEVIEFSDPELWFNSEEVRLKTSVEDGMCDTWWTVGDEIELIESKSGEQFLFEFVKACNDLKVSVKDGNGDYRSMYDILSDLSKVWTIFL